MIHMMAKCCKRHTQLMLLDQKMLKMSTQEPWPFFKPWPFGHTWASTPEVIHLAFDSKPTSKKGIPHLWKPPVIMMIIFDQLLLSVVTIWFDSWDK